MSDKTLSRRAFLEDLSGTGIGVAFLATDIASRNAYAVADFPEFEPPGNRTTIDGVVDINHPEGYAYAGRVADAAKKAHQIYSTVLEIRLPELPIDVFYRNSTRARFVAGRIELSADIVDKYRFLPVVTHEALHVLGGGGSNDGAFEGLAEYMRWVHAWPYSNGQAKF